MQTQRLRTNGSEAVADCPSIDADLRILVISGTDGAQNIDSRADCGQTCLIAVGEITMKRQKFAHCRQITQHWLIVHKKLTNICLYAVFYGKKDIVAEVLLQ